MIRRSLILASLFQVSAAAPPERIAVVVATRAYAVGEVVNLEGITQKSVAPEWASKSIVLPNAASYIVNQPTTVPILAGDLLRWSFFESRRGTKVPEACGQPDDAARMAIAKARAVQLERR